MPGREIDEQIQHDHIVKLLYHEYYHYPSKAHPHLIASANHPLKTKAVFDADGREFFPDIVVIHADSDRLMMVAEVETESTVNVREAQQWKDFSGLDCKFYLYVPRGFGTEAMKLSRGLEVTEIVQYWKENTRLILERFGQTAAEKGTANPQ